MVEDLKIAIKMAKPFLKVDADDLRIYRAEIDASDDEDQDTRIAELQKLSKRLGKSLDEQKPLSRMFCEDPHPQSLQKKIYALVGLPGGESIDSVWALVVTSWVIADDVSPATTHCYYRPV